MPEQTAQWLTVKQISEKLQVHPETIRRAIYEKKLRAVKFKGWRVSPEALEEYLQAEEKRVAAA